ncbi:MAG: YfiR family protein [Pseudomonadota bacterium]|nr:YfiR family protein [Pseudomonadota bacterium]
MSLFLHLTWALAMLTTAAVSAPPDDVVQREDQFKAAYVFNFVKFVAWPEDTAADPLLVCFVGAERVYGAFTATIDRSRPGMRRLAALQIADASPAGTCNVLYIDAATASGYALPHAPNVLTISDADGFAANGGMIELFTENHRLRFVINVGSAQQAGLRISSDLLKLAVDVRREPR